MIKIRYSIDNSIYFNLIYLIIILSLRHMWPRICFLCTEELVARRVN